MRLDDETSARRDCSKSSPIAHQGERAYHTKGQIKVGSVPTNMIFNPDDNSFFDSTTSYTHVGFK